MEQDKQTIIAQKTLDNQQGNIRNSTFDIAKGLCIIGIVGLHCHMPLYKFNALFLVAVFFMFSGYFFKEKYISDINSLGNFCKKKIKSLYIPFVVFNIIYTIFHNLLLKINFYTVNTDFLINLNPIQLGGFSHFYTIKDICIKSLLSIVMYHIDFLINPLWFVKVLFFISVFYAIVGFIIYKFFPKQKEKIMMLLALLSLFIGFFMFKKHFKFYNIDLIFSYVFLYHLGYLWKKYEYRIKSSVFLTSVILLIIYYFTFPNTILYSANKYQNPIVLILLSTCGFFATIFVSQCINNYCF